MDSEYDLHKKDTNFGVMAEDIIVDIIGLDH